jgi:hypothetical protein
VNAFTAEHFDAADVQAGKNHNRCLCVSWLTSETFLPFLSQIKPHTTLFEYRYAANLPISVLSQSARNAQASRSVSK